VRSELLVHPLFFQALLLPVAATAALTLGRRLMAVLAVAAVVAVASAQQMRPEVQLARPGKEMPVVTDLAQPSYQPVAAVVAQLKQETWVEME